MKARRQVFVKLVGTEDHGTFFVFYAERRKRQRYAAAQFHALDWTSERVSEWVAENRPELELVEEPK